MTSISRRELLKRVGSAGAVAAGLEAAGLKPRATLVGRASTDVAESAEAAQGASPAIVIAGQPVTIGITPASPLTARITLAAAGSGAPALRSDGSLVERTWPAPAAPDSSAATLAHGSLRRSHRARVGAGLTWAGRPSD